MKVAIVGTCNTIQREILRLAKEAAISTGVDAETIQYQLNAIAYHDKVKDSLISPILFKTPKKKKINHKRYQDKYIKRKFRLRGIING